MISTKNWAFIFWALGLLFAKIRLKFLWVEDNDLKTGRNKDLREG